MIIRIVSGTTLKVIEVEDCSQIVVMTDQGDPCCIAHETAQRVVIAGHAAEDNFQDLLRAVGMKPQSPTQVLKGHS